MSVIKLSDYENRRAVPNPEYFRILVDCRDLTTHRLLVSFTSMMDRLGDRLLDAANRSSVLSESTLLLETRAGVQSNRAYIVSGFETALRDRIDRRLRGEHDGTPAKSAGTEEGDGEEQALELVDHAQVEEDIAVKNFVRTLSNTCHDQLLPLNARIGFLLGERELATEANPFGPMSLGLAFRDAWRDVELRAEGKVAVLRMLDESVVGDVNSIYADLNRHLANLNVLPNLTPVSIMRSGAGRTAAYATKAGGHGADGAGGADGAEAVAPKPDREVDLFEMLRDLFSRLERTGRAPAGAPFGFGALANLFPASPWVQAGYAAPAGAGADAFNPWAGFGIAQDTPIVGGTMASGAPGGAQQGYLVNPQIIESLTRLQQSFGSAGAPSAAPVSAAPADGATVTATAPAAIDPNVLRRLTPRDLGSTVDATGAMTIELVAMLFDFVSADRQLPDGIKALLGRLQIPVLKAAMLDKEFFSRRKHPARLLVNRYAEAGIAWRPEQGTTDPLYVKIQEGVGRIQSEFTDQLSLFSDILSDFERFLADEEQNAEQIVQASAEDITTNERQELAEIVAQAELDRRINSAQPPEFLEKFLRNQWRCVLIGTYVDDGEEGDDWRAVLADMDNLLWSVQPKRTAEARKDLVSRLPEMLSRLRKRLADVEWAKEDREAFLSDLASTHARAVTATKEAPAAAAAAPTPLTGALAGLSDEEVAPLPDRDQYHELADTMMRGMWVEFTEESGVLVFAKLSWVSPLRGKYLFTHRNGLKAFSLTREELAQRFRDDTARPVESEPLLDRAFSDVMSRLSAQVGA